MSDSGGLRSKLKHLALGESSHSHPPAGNPHLPELPVEIWLLIAEYMEPKDKRKLLGVNRLFYELAMDELYSRLSLVSDDPWLFIDTMETLCNPHVGYRVRSVTIWPAATWRAMSNPKPEWSRWLRPPEQEGTRAQVSSWWRRHVSKSKGSSSPISPSPKPPPPPPVAPSEAARIALFNKAIQHLTRVEELTIYINGTVEKKVDLSYPMTECLHKLWAPLKTTLRQVSIDTPSCMAGLVLPQAAELPALLQRVELMLRRSTNVVTDPDLEGPQEAVSRFTQDIGRIESLKAFRFSPDFNIGNNYNLWHSLMDVRPMEMITSLTIENIGQTPVDDPVETDLHQWIMRHQQLRELSLAFSVYSYVHPTLRATILRPVPGYVDPENNVLPNLTTLTLKLDRAPDDRYPAYLRWIASISPNLTHLNLKNIKRTSHLQMLLDHFAAPINSTSGIRLLPKLEGLELNTDTLCPELFNTLARRCPNLVKLKLDVQVIATKEGMTTNQLNSSTLTSDPNSPFYVNVRAREETDVIKKLHESGKESHLSTYYKNWKLEDVSILQWVYGEGRKYNWEVMSALADVVPNIRSFVGRGHKEQTGLKELEQKFELVGFGKRSEAWS